MGRKEMDIKSDRKWSVATYNIIACGQSSRASSKKKDQYLIFVCKYRPILIENWQGLEA